MRSTKSSNHGTILTRITSCDRFAFSMIELSVVLVVISIMLTTTLVARGLAARAVYNKIHEEYLHFRRSIIIFNNIYGCKPGSCFSENVMDLISSGLSKECAIVKRNDAISSSTKRSCMMHSLHLAGYIEDVDHEYNSTLQLSHSISGKNMPHAKFSKTASWDYATRPNNRGRMLNTLILRNTNYSQDDELSIHNVFVGAADWRKNKVEYGISATMSHKLDVKFDDGMPHSGLIQSKRNAFDNNTGAKSCYQLFDKKLVVSHFMSSAMAWNEELFDSIYHSPHQKREESGRVHTDVRRDKKSDKQEKQNRSSSTYKFSTKLDKKRNKWFIVRRDKKSDKRHGGKDSSDNESDNKNLNGTQRSDKSSENTLIYIKSHGIKNGCILEYVIRD